MSRAALLLWWQILMLGLHAGIFIGIGAGLALVINSSLVSIETTGDLQITVPVPAGVRKLVAGAVFPLGLVLVVQNGSELFSGNVMYLAAAKLAGKVSWLDLAKNWIVTYFGNLAGSLAVAFFLFHETELFKGGTEYLYLLAKSKTAADMWWAYVLRGVGCNYLVCMALWGAASADDAISKIAALWWPIFGFIALGFEHSVANMFFVPLAIMEGYDISVNEFIERNLVPVTIGNIVGGLLYIFVQFLVYQKDVQDMRLQQGGKHNPFSKRQPPRNDIPHSIPTQSDTLWCDIFLWCMGTRSSRQVNDDETRPKAVSAAAASTETPSQEANVELGRHHYG